MSATGSLCETEVRTSSPQIVVLPRTVLRTREGVVLPLEVDRWYAEPGPDEAGVLDRAAGPVLDVGCGPGRHTLALMRRGVTALGIDVSKRAVRLARGRGAAVIRRSVFDPLPDPGGWGTVLLLDGNVGIGGDPRRLLSRARSLLRPRGRVLLEVEGPGAPTRSLLVRVEHGAEMGVWFPWAQVGIDALGALCRAARLEVAEAWREGARWFARLGPA